MNRWHLLGIVTLLIIIAGIALFIVPNSAQAPSENGGATTTPATSTTPQKASFEDLIVVDSPLPGESVSSPLIITGKARGTWYFEASFPIDVIDWDGRIIAQGHAEAQSDWMTEAYVPFVARITYTTPVPGDPTVNRGTIIIHKDNPSGLPEHDRVLEFPIVFK